MIHEYELNGLVNSLTVTVQIHDVVLRGMMQKVKTQITQTVMVLILTITIICKKDQPSQWKVKIEPRIEQQRTWRTEQY